MTRPHLNGAELSWTDLSETKMRKADLRFVHAVNAHFCGADLRDCIFFKANLGDANLNGTILAETNLSNVNLREASLVRTNLEGANLVDCFIYGISVWNVKLEDAIQKNLIITELGKPKITVDNLEIAQFIYLLLNNKKI
jgi:uncharacterized protein YjbI with pentapeptide repeats